MRWGICLILLVSCGIPELDGSEKECPCADGFVCDETRNRCVELDAGEDDAGSDTGEADVGLDDAAFDVGFPDVMDLDGGADVGVDAGRDAGADDAGRDSALPDTGPPPDVGTDAGSPDMCPRGGLYCTNFEEATPPYARRGGGTFATRAPGYMSAEAGYYASDGVAAFTEFDSVTVPSNFYVRFWYRIEVGSFNTEGAIFGVLLPGGSDEGVLITLQNESGLITVTAGSTAGGPPVSDTYGPPGDMWTCIRLDVRPTGLDLEIDDQGEVSTSFPPFTRPFDDIAFGILGAGIDASAIAFDDVLVSDSPIPCTVP